MNDRTRIAVASAIAVACVLGLGAFAHYGKRDPLPRFRVTQRNVAYDELWQGSPAGVILTIDEGIIDREERPGHATYRVVDAQGREYPLRGLRFMEDQMALWIPLGYARPPAAPRLEATLAGRTKGVPLSAFPQVPPTDPRPSPDAPFRLFETETGTRVVPLRPIPKDESWTMTALATRYAPDLRCPKQSGEAMVSSGYGTTLPRFTELPLPYAHDAGWVKLSVDVSRPEERVADVTIKNLRLGKLNGETGFLIGAPRSVPNPFGWTITVPVQRGQVRTSSIDHRNPRLEMRIDHHFFYPGPIVSEGDPKDGTLQMELLHPRPEELGVNSLLIGTGVQASHPGHGSVAIAPFDAVVRMRYRRDISLSHHVYIVPIRPSPKAHD